MIEGMDNLIKQLRKLVGILEFNPSAIKLGRKNPYSFLGELSQKFELVLYIDEKKTGFCGS